MESRFGLIEVLEPRKDEEVLEEKEAEARRKMKRKGFQPVDKQEDTGFQLSAFSEEINSKEGLEQYLDSCRGYGTGQVEVYATGRGNRGNDEIAEGVPVRVDFDDDRFLQAYEALQQEFDVEKVGFNMAGYGRDIIEAFKSVVPLVTYMIEENEQMTAIVSYRNGGMVESIWNEDEDFKKLYDAFSGTGLGYEGAFADGIDDEEWILAEHGFEDLYRRR